MNKKLDEIVIHIFEASEGGYMYDIYESEGDIVNGEQPIDGGHCTSTIENALDMAHSQVSTLFKKGKPTKYKRKNITIGTYEVISELLETEANNTDDTERMEELEKALAEIDSLV